MSADLKGGWFCDHSPGRGRILGAALSGVGGGYYFEVQDVGSSADGQVCVGICGASFNLERPWNLAVAGNGIGLANGAFAAAGNNGNFGASRAYPTNPGGGVFLTLVTDGVDKIGVAVDTINGKVWWRNATAAPNSWEGDTTVGYTSAQVAAGTGGFTIGAAGLGPISGPIYILVGAGYDGTGIASQGTLNAGASAFVATPPTGFVAWDTTGATTLNPLDAATEIILSGGNLHFTTSLFAGANQPVVMVRSNTYKLRA